VTKIYDESCNLVSGVALRKKKENGVGNGAAEIKCLLQLLLHISLMKNFSGNIAGLIWLHSGDNAAISIEISAERLPQLLAAIRTAFHMGIWNQRELQLLLLISLFI